MAFNGFSGKFGSTKQERKELNFCGRINIQMELCQVKEVAPKLMINGSSQGTQIFVCSGFKITNEIFTRVKFVAICVKFLYE
jgi:hypothetical protein